VGFRVFKMKEKGVGLSRAKPHQWLELTFKRKITKATTDLKSWKKESGQLFRQSRVT